ncbi:SH3 domain-containing protein [Flavobacterium oreochromis]|uniref:SH3 domain-containing protein n=1 Tax=Flavobacterium oreochromis TaxID=2906078 RepID=A0ABW8PAP0_9FLAO|nr:SH3 domain-containing protein [Flavobacterium oreochromis]OWP74913.1 hypothetical protein BWG23_12475 [Flavobacterium oreochromis]
MRKTIFRSLIFALFIASCKDNNNINENKIEMDSNSITKKYEDNLYKTYEPLMIKYLKDEGFKFLDDAKFKERIQELLGIDIDKSEYDDVEPRLEGADLNIHNIYSIMRKDNFIDFYILDRGEIDGAGDPLKSLLTDDRNKDDNFIIYNKLLLNDDNSALNYVLNDKSSLEDIYVYFNYEKNEVIREKLISTLTNVDDYPIEFKNSLIWYNNIKRQDNIRKNTLIAIGNKNPDFLFDLTNYLITNRKIIKKPFNTFVDKTIACLISIQLNLGSKDKLTNKGYMLLNNMFLSDSSMKEVFKKGYYYNYDNLKEAIKYFETSSQENIGEDLYVINDKDGYTNLRKGKSSSSEIIGKINTGTEIFILDENDKDWWLIETTIGEQGYIHKSRIVKKK